MAIIKNLYQRFELLLLYFVLLFFGVQTYRFGKGKAKKLRDLLREIKTGDCELVIYGPQMYRTVCAVRASIKYKDKILKEVKQVFSDSRADRVRGFLYISEKKSPKEGKEVSLRRAVIEELGIHSDINFSFTRERTETRESPSYPGLKSIYTFIDFDVVLTDEQFKEDGYIEKEGSTGLTTYFEWVPYR